MSIRLSRDSFEYLGATKESDLASKKDSILNYLSENSNIESNTIAQAINLPAGTVRRLLHLLREEGKVVSHGKGVKNDPELWTITESREGYED